MNNTYEIYTPEEIKYARKRAEYLHMHDNPEMKFAVIAEKLHTNYHTFRAWCLGFVDYFDNKLSLIADLFGVSVDNLVGRTENKEIGKVVELRAKF